MEGKDREPLWQRAIAIKLGLTPTEARIFMFFVENSETAYSAGSLRSDKAFLSSTGDPTITKRVFEKAIAKLRKAGVIVKAPQPREKSTLKLHIDTACKRNYRSVMSPPIKGEQFYHFDLEGGRRVYNGPAIPEVLARTGFDFRTVRFRKSRTK